MLEPFPDQGPIRFHKSRDAGSVVNACVAFIRQNARELLVGFFALVIPFALMSGIGMALYFRRFGALFADPTVLEDDPAAFAELFGPSYFVLIVGSLLAFGMGMAAVAAYVRLYRDGEAGSITVGHLWDEAKGLILPIMGMYILYALALMFSGVIIIVPCLGVIAWMAFMVWSMPYAHVMFASRMTESSSIGEAFQRAKYLVKGSWTAAFFPLLLSWLLSYLALMIISIPLYIIMMVVMVNSIGASSDPTAAMGLMGYVSAPMQILGMAAYIVPTLAAFFVHSSLVEEVEGYSVDDDLDLFEQGVQTSSTSSWDDTPVRGARGPGTPPPSSPASGATDRPASADDTTPGDTETDDSPGGFRGGSFGS